MSKFKVGDRVSRRYNHVSMAAIVLLTDDKRYLIYNYHTYETGWVEECYLSYLHEHNIPITVYVVCDEKGNPQKGNSLFWDKEPADRLVDMLHSNGFRNTRIRPYALTPINE